MISLEASRACAAALAAERLATLLYPEDVDAKLAEAARAAGAEGAVVLALLRPLLALASEKVAGLTFWVPGFGTVVFLTARALADGPTLLSVVAHELVHARQIDVLGPVQAGVDYAGSGELRALREAEAGGVGLWARYLVTGVRPSPDDAGVVSSDLYHLDAPNRAFARAVVESSLLPLELGAVPPHSVARAVLAWLREHAPEAIVAEEYRARATEVPS